MNANEKLGQIWKKLIQTESIDTIVQLLKILISTCDEMKSNGMQITHIKEEIADLWNKMELEAFRQVIESINSLKQDINSLRKEIGKEKELDKFLKIN